MFLGSLEIENNIQWLTENASPPVVYLTNRNFLHADPESNYMKDLWRRVKAKSIIIHSVNKTGASTDFQKR